MDWVRKGGRIDSCYECGFDYYRCEKCGKLTKVNFGTVMQKDIPAV
jgi:hypothetical protein